MKCATEPYVSPVISILPLAIGSNGGQVITKELRVHKHYIVQQYSVTNVHKVVAWIAHFHQHKLCLICYD